jgi:hypothetical protein
MPSALPRRGFVVPPGAGNSFVTPSSPGRDRQRVEQNRAAQTSVRTAIWQRADGVAETDCVAGVIGLEL